MSNYNRVLTLVVPCLFITILLSILVQLDMDEAILDLFPSASQEIVCPAFELKSEMRNDTTSLHPFGPFAVSVSDIAVVVLTSQATHKRLDLIMSSWAVDVENLYFVSDAEHEKPPTIVVNGGVGERCVKAVIHVMVKMTKQPKPRWLVIVDDDTYLFVPSLLRRLSYYDPLQEQLYMGLRHTGIIQCRPGKTPPTEWINGGAGIVLSWALVRTLMQIPPKENCLYYNWSGINGDLALGCCVSEFGLPLTAVGDVDDEKDFHYHRINPKNPSPLSSVPITFHHTRDWDMHHIDSAVRSKRPDGLFWLWSDYYLSVFQQTNEEVSFRFLFGAYVEVRHLKRGEIFRYPLQRPALELTPGRFEMIYYAEDLSVARIFFTCGVCDESTLVSAAAVCSFSTCSEDGQRTLRASIAGPCPFFASGFSHLR